MTQIVLDADAFKALSSDTRLQILKALDARRLTVSELGRLLALNKATVFEHLKQLAQADLVKKEDEGRKWVYYKLTWKGKNVVHPENVQFMLLLATGLLSVGGLVAQLGSLLAWWGGAPTPSRPSNGPASTGVRENQVLRADTGAQQDSAPAAGASPSSTATPGPTEGSGQGTLDQAGGVPAPGDGTGAVPAADTASWWQDQDWWLIAVLGALLLATVWFVFEYARAQGREKRALAKRIGRLPPEVS